MKKKKYPVIHITFSHPSFAWGPGMYIVLAKRDGEMKMCRLHKDGTAELFQDGRYMITCTGTKHKGVTKTNLSYTGAVYEG